MAATRTRPLIVWFRRDLRLADNPALSRAAEAGKPVIPLYVHDTDPESPYSLCGRVAGWSLANATALGEDLRRQLNSRLVIRAGSSARAVLALASQVDATTIQVAELNEPEADAADGRLASAAREQGVEVVWHPGNLLLKPGTVTKEDGSTYRVFTPFYRQFIRQYRHAPPLGVPSSLPSPESWPASDELADLANRDTETGVGPGSQWSPGSSAAVRQLSGFIDESLVAYSTDRDMLDRPSTSGISPYLQCGSLSIRQVWDAIERRRGAGDPETEESVDAFQRQLVWREFSYQVLAAFPSLATQPHREEFARFPWRPDDRLLEHWQRGETGYPVVDAAMRQLSSEGWMPGRVRMVVASFLVKHLLQNWTRGEQWFRKRLADADLACNAFNWQWVAGCGFDAAPYFRVFNPVAQGTRFDPAGEYVRQHVPELRRLPSKYIHSPWTAPDSVLSQAEIDLGRSYPRPVVEHAAARERALAAFHGLRSR
jgi:deoxyribodipyrimidine photo-lyase